MLADYVDLAFRSVTRSRGASMTMFTVLALASSSEEQRAPGRLQRAPGDRTGRLRVKIHIRRPFGMATFLAGAASMPACVENECVPY